MDKIDHGTVGRAYLPRVVIEVPVKVLTPDGEAIKTYLLPIGEEMITMLTSSFAAELSK